jgi:predicted AAA+ superfamily ATPase
MDAAKLRDIHLRLSTLAVFRALLDDEVISALNLALARAAVVAAEARPQGAVDEMPYADAYELSLLYADFVARLFAHGAPSLASYVLGAALEDENVYLRQVGEGKTPSDPVADAVRRELETLQLAADLAPDDFTGLLPESMARALPGFGVERVDVAGVYRERVENIGRHGYGIYARYDVFRVDAEGSIVPVRHPDAQRLDDLVDYDREKGIILENTRALLRGLPAANILLTGDAGTGKSSTVKAVANELAPEGLRILEVRKEQLRDIPSILDELTRNPLKFIIFIDDLAFAAEDDNFAALKAILEGSVSAKSANVVIYATSNRRHLVRERFSDREGDEVHRNDTLQELGSLSARFGLRVSFMKPEKKAYLEFAQQLAESKGLRTDPETLALKAEQFALRSGGRSPRTAKQLIELLAAEEDHT